MAASHSQPGSASDHLGKRLLTLRDFLWRFVICLHLVAAVFWWWMMPAGFPVDHPRFWCNEILPTAVAAACAASLFAERRQNLVLVQALSAAIPAFWWAATITAVSLFPISARRFLPPAALAGLAVSALFTWRFLGEPWNRRHAVSAALIAAAMACAAVLIQQGPASDTRPVNVSFSEMGKGTKLPPPAIGLALGTLQPYDAALRLSFPLAEVATSRRLTIDVRPMLTFESRSPDRCWTIFSPQKFRDGPFRKLTGYRDHDQQWECWYDDDGRSQLRVSIPAGDRAVNVEACSRLDAPIYSHLNSFTELQIRGHRRLFVAYSPCPDVHIEFEPADYPIGRPTHVACVSEGDLFRVLQAASGEKGPFRELARGMLTRSEPLILTLFDDERPVCRIVLEDWAAQSARGLSPTAGWGLPLNAIEFQRLTDNPDGMAALWITLAGTSVGRGWDSVGHSAGAYRNRMRIESITP